MFKGLKDRREKLRASIARVVVNEGGGRSIKTHTWLLFEDRIETHDGVFPLDPSARAEVVDNRRATGLLGHGASGDVYLQVSGEKFAAVGFLTAAQTAAAVRFATQVEAQAKRSG